MTPSITYATSADWQRFTGCRRVSGDVLRLGHSNTATDLGLTGTVVNYRFGQSQSLISDVGSLNDGTPIIMGAGALQFTEDGIRSRGDNLGSPPDDTNCAAVRMGGPLSGYTVLQSSTTPAPGIVHDTVVSFWVTIPSNRELSGTVYGLEHAKLPQQADDHVSFQFGNINYGSSEIDGNGTESSISAYFGASQFADDKPHHVLLHTFWCQEPPPDFAIKTRLFIDGKWVGETNGSTRTPPIVQLGPMGTAPPAILALSYCPGVGYSVQDPFSDAIDEFSISHCNVTPGTGGTHQVNQTWMYGDQVLAVPKRHPDQDVLGQDHSIFSIIGPVETIAGGDDNTISHVRLVTSGASGVLVFPVLGNLLGAWVANYDFQFTYIVNDFDAMTITNRVTGVNATVARTESNWPGPMQRDNNTQGLFLFDGFTVSQTMPFHSSGTLSIWIQRNYQGGNLVCFRGAGGTSSSDPASPTIYLSPDGFVHAKIYDTIYGVYRTLNFAQDFGSDWRMITLTWAPGVGAALYVDAVLRDSIIMASPGLPFANDANVTLWIGGSNADSIDSFQGGVDEFVYLQTALDQEGVNELLVGASYANFQSKSAQVGVSSRVQVALRASNTVFTASDSNLPWSNWYDITSSLMFPVGCSGSGKYVQAKIRIYPSSDAQRLYSPEIKRLELIEPQDWDGNYTTTFSTGIPPWLFIDNPTYWTMDTGMLKLTPFQSVPQLALVDPSNGGIVATMVAGVRPSGSGFFLVFGYRSHSDFYFAGEMTDPTDGLLKWMIGHYGGPGSVTIYAKRQIVIWAGMAFNLTFGVIAANVVQLFLGGDYALDYTFPDLSQITSLPVGIGGINANFKIDNLTVVYRQRTYGDGNADVNAHLSVLVSSTFGAKIRVFCRGNADCGSRIRVYFKGTPVDAGAALRVKNTSSFDCHLRVKNHSDLNATITVSVLGASCNLEARITVVRNDSDLPARITVLQPRSTSDLNAKIRIPLHSFSARIKVFHRGASPLESAIYVTPRLPGPVRNLQSSVPANTWQLNTRVKFTWDHAIPTSTPIAGYYFYFGIEPSPKPSKDWTFTTQLYTDAIVRDSGKSYFTIAAIDTNGLFGPTRTCGIWLNHPPTVPGDRFMKINGYSTINEYPLVARYPYPFHVLTWNPSTDVDTADTANITYEIEFASRYDFGTIPGTDISSVVQVDSNIAGTTFNWSNVPVSGVLFWHIRASDGKEFSDWSRVGGFIVNTPPLQPTELLVRQD